VTPAQALDQYRRALANHGEDVIVRRWSGPSGARVKVEATARGRVVGYQPHQVVGPIIAGDRRVIMINDPVGPVAAGNVALSTLLPLTPADKLVLRGRECAIKAADDNTRRIAGVLVALELQIAG
jgi:hypothetical protein